MLIKAGVDIKIDQELPCEVYHPEAPGPAVWFGTWKEALAMQVKWNKIVPGHIARKRRVIC